MGTVQYTYIRKDLEQTLEKALGKTLGEVDVANVFLITKTNPKVTGIAGMVIEQSILGYWNRDISSNATVASGFPHRARLRLRADSIYWMNVAKESGLDI